MRKSFSFIAMILAILPCAAGQTSEVVSIGFVNAVGLETKTEVRIDGQNLKPAGFSQGRFVESFGVSQGNHTLVFSNGSCAPLTQSITANPGSTSLYLLYKTAIRNPDGTFKNQLKLSVIANLPRAGGRQFLGFYASDAPSTSIRVNNSDVTIKKLQLTQIGEGTLAASTGPGEPERYHPSEAGNYVLVLFDGADSRLRQTLVQIPQ